jgi:hypothetical protein
VVAILALGGAAGCSNGVAGGRPSDGGTDLPVEQMPHLPPPDANCPADAAGGGLCPINFCGAPKTVAALGPGEVAQLGADAICTPGYVCVPDGATSAGDALQLRCVAPLAPAVDFGAACTKGAGTASRCRNDALCIEAAAAPGMPFCSALCRSDGDCPLDSYCLEYKSDTLPMGSYVNLGYCTPKAKITGTACEREADCPADQGCVAYGARTSLMTCQKVGGTKSMGDPCTKGSQCRSGQCFDRDFHADSNRSFCSGPCGKSSDCGADQRCARVVLSTNGTPADPRDDVVAGLCQSLFVSVAANGCQKNEDCTTDGADTCSMKYGLCYKAGVASGAPCTGDPSCELGAVCTLGPRFPGGYCQTFGCAPNAAVGSVDRCPGANATCVQRGSDDPLNACYEGCTRTADCSRAAQSFMCESPAKVTTTRPDGGASDAAAPDGGAGDAGAEAGQPPSICIFDQGV